MQRQPVLGAELGLGPDQHLDAGGQSHAGGRLEGAEHPLDVAAPDDGPRLGDEGPAGVALGELEVDMGVAVDAHDLGGRPDALPKGLLDGGGHAGEQLRERHTLAGLGQFLAGQLGRIDRQPAGERLEVPADRHEPLARLAVPAGALGLGFGLVAETGR